MLTDSTISPATFEALYNLRGSGAGTLPVEPLGGNPSGRSLVLIPPITGGMVGYTVLIDTLSTYHSVFAVHYPRWIPDPSRDATDFISELGSLYASSIGRCDWSSPPVVIGWSLGATLALDCVAKLAEAGQPASVVMIDPSPMEVPLHQALPPNGKERDRYLWECYLQVRLYPDQIAQVLADGFWELSDKARLAMIGRYDQRITGPFMNYHHPVDLGWELEFTRRCVIGAANYTPPYYNGDVHLLCCEQFLRSTERDWPEDVLPGRKMIIVPGNHHSLILNQGIRPLKKLVDAL